jgi:hypothetical protein
LSDQTRPIWLQALFLRLRLLRYEIGLIPPAVGLNAAVVVVVSCLVSSMVAVVVLLLMGRDAVLSLGTGTGLGAILGLAACCLLMPLVDTVTPETLQAAHARIKATEKALAEKAEALRAYHEQEARREARQAHAELESLIRKTTAQEAGASTSGWGGGPICWYCRQRLMASSLQCCYCRMLNRVRAA